MISIIKRRVRARALGAMACMAAATVPMQSEAATGRLIVTGGATTVEGVAGGGVVPLALISGLASKDEIGGVGFASHLMVDDFKLNAYGGAINIHDRFEISLSRLDLSIPNSVTGRTVIGLGVADNDIKMDVVGVKYRIAGDAMYQPDTWLPQIAIGAQYKKNRDENLMRFLSADDSGYDIYLAATKVYLASVLGRNAFINGVVRYTDANYLGLFGFGNQAAGGDDDRSFQTEFSGGILITPQLLFGGEFKTMHDSKTLGGAVNPSTWKDVFIAYFPTKNVSVAAAYANLGQVGLAADDNQTGFYMSLQVTF